mmetsp:Transcript_6891/g.20067  ORF Transcript_6891/g.20067 Transcript_6891/m.20067 type:complete len:227 (+) Transcript_6891:776-1456(+)
MRRQRAGAQAALLPPAAHDGRHAHARATAAHVDGAHALGPVDLVRRQAHDVDVHVVHVDGHLAQHLRRVGVEDDLPRLAHLPDGLDVLRHADLIVHGHDRHQRRVRAHGGLQQLQVNGTVLAHREIRHLEVLLLQRAAAVEHALVLDLRRDHVLLAVAVEVADALDGHVVGLRRAAREDDLARVRSNEACYLFARVLHGLVRVPPELVRAAVRVPELVRLPRQHRV